MKLYLFGRCVGIFYCYIAQHIILCTGTSLQTVTFVQLATIMSVNIVTPVLYILIEWFGTHARRLSGHIQMSRPHVIVVFICKVRG